LASPFQREDFEKLGCDAVEVLRLRCRKLVAEHERRGCPLPSVIDRVYDNASIRRALAWEPTFGFNEVLAQMDRRSLEVLPYTRGFVDRAVDRFGRVDSSAGSACFAAYAAPTKEGAYRSFC